MGRRSRKTFDTNCNRRAACRLHPIRSPTRKVASMDGADGSPHWNLEGDHLDSGGTSKRTNGNCNTGRIGAAAIRTSYRRRPCLRRLHTRRQQPRISSSTSARIDGSAGTWRCVGHVVGRNAWPARAAVGFSFRRARRTGTREHRAECAARIGLRR